MHGCRCVRLCVRAWLYVSIDACTPTCTSEALYNLISKATGPLELKSGEAMPLKRVVCNFELGPKADSLGGRGR